MRSECHGSAMDPLRIRPLRLCYGHAMDAPRTKMVSDGYAIDVPWADFKYCVALMCYGCASGVLLMDVLCVCIQSAIIIVC